ncbi:hypothetical protein [Brevibacillus fortis]|uniref:hypothetical protein n=1 Tax=Brevibacillus fortis TaxID=2126352 RepID=UPI0038FCFE2E
MSLPKYEVRERKEEYASFGVYRGGYTPKQKVSPVQTDTYTEVILRKHAEYVKIGLSDELDGLSKQITTLNDTIINLSHGLEQMASGSGGGGDMDDLKRRVEKLENKIESIDTRLSGVETNVLLIKENTKKLESMPTSIEIQHFISQAITESLKPIPTEDKVKTIVRDIVKSDKVTTEDFVEKTVGKAKLHLIFWYIGTALALGSLVFGIIRFLKP